MPEEEMSTQGNKDSEFPPRRTPQWVEMTPEQSHFSPVFCAYNF